MSRIGRLPVVVPPGVKVDIHDTLVRVKGPKGELQASFSPAITLGMENGQVVVTRHSDEASFRALHGTTRALINNMVVGVSTGFVRVLEIDGVGYRAEMSGKNLMLNLGYSHPIEYPPPDGIAFATDTKTRTITISGVDKEMVGEIAARVRKLRPPEPYKGKGIRYKGEVVRKLPGKTVAATGGAA